MQPNIFVEVLQNSCSLIEKINARDMRNLRLLYKEDAVVEIKGFSQFVGVEQIQRFWTALVSSLNSHIAYRDVKIDCLDDDVVSLTATLTADGHRFIAVELNQLWVNSHGRWLISKSDMLLQAGVLNASDSFLDFIQTFSVSLQNWLNGQDVSEENWLRLTNAYSDEMGIVLVDGQKFSGVEIRERVKKLSACDPDLVLEVSQIEVLTMSDSLCVVSFLESRRVKDESSFSDFRSTLAFAKKSPEGWSWRHVQQTREKSG